MPTPLRKSSFLIHSLARSGELRAQALVITLSPFLETSVFVFGARLVSKLSSAMSKTTDKRN